MAFKFIIAFALIAVASSGLVPATQIYHAAQPVLAKSVDPHPQYQFSYSVNDALTGDVKSQFEGRNGDVVQGEYSLNDADGYKRTVQYSSDAVHGFNAFVNREPLGQILRTASAPSSLVKDRIAYVSYNGPSYTPTYNRAAAATASLIRSSPIVYSHGPASYTTQGLLRSGPIAYSIAPAYASASDFTDYH